MPTGRPMRLSRLLGLPRLRPLRVWPVSVAPEVIPTRLPSLYMGLEGWTIKLRPAGDAAATIAMYFSRLFLIFVAGRCGGPLKLGYWRRTIEAWEARWIGRRPGCF